MFNTQLIIDADYSQQLGWELSFRFDIESMESAYSGVSDADLPNIVGNPIASILIAERDNHKTPARSASDQ